MRTLKYGGKLSPGDFIAVSNGNCIDFGWYVGDGIGGTLQYYTLRAPFYAYKEYKEWDDAIMEDKKRWWRSKQYTNGFTKKCLWKAYINAVHSTRVIKLNRPEEIFTEQEDIELYEKSKEVLIMLKFIEK